MSIIFVDNTPDGELAGTLLFPVRTPELIYVHEPRPGIPFARNAALRAALRLGCDYIAFIDDDEIAPSSWIETLYSEIRSSGADVVHGSLTRVPTLDEAIAKAGSHVPAPGKIRWRKTAATNNVIFKTWLVKGPVKLEFDEVIAAVGGSDTEFFMRAHDAGAKIARSSQPPVFEAWDEGRVTSKYVSKRAWRCGASTNYRYRKNRRAAVAASILLVRASWRVVDGMGNCLKGAAVYFFNSRKSNMAVRKGISSLCFAVGCLTPYAGVSPKTYY